MRASHIALLLLSLILAPIVPTRAASAACGPDATLVGPTCVDTYEASVWSIPPGNNRLVRKIEAGTATLADLARAGATQVSVADAAGCSPAFPASFPVTGNWTAPLYAASIPGVTPTACVSWFQAEQACALSGKRLPTNQEWQRAAAGTVDPGSNDGLTNAMCNTNAAGPRSGGSAGATPGGADSCISNWGVQDMVGNVSEWVADWGDLAGGTCANWPSAFGDDVSCIGGGSGTLPGALVRGGSWMGLTAAGVFNVVAHLDPSNQLTGFGVLGFRCAR